MDIAKAMALGGQIVHANKCNFSSYDDLKLRCPVCGEPVRLKKGGTRKPHFAHFPGTDPKQVEECELRASIYSKNTKINSSIENRGQRLKIFQQHFLSLIYVGQKKIVDNVKFNNWINSIQRDNNIAINNITKDCIEYFIMHRQIIVKKYILPSSKIEDKQILHQQKIALEAIDYLCVKSSYILLEYIISYSVYQLYKNEKDNLFKQKLTNTNIYSICCFAIKIIIFNPWIKALYNTTNINSLTINTYQAFETEIIKMFDIQHNRSNHPSLNTSVAETNLTKYTTKQDTTISSYTDNDTRVSTQLKDAGFDGSNIETSNKEYINGIENNYQNIPIPNTVDNLVEINVVPTVTTLIANTDNNKDLSVSGSGQDALFWLKRVSLHWNEYHCLNDFTETQLRNKLTITTNVNEKQAIINHLQRSETFKKYLTFEVYHSEISVFNEFLQWCNRLGLIVNETDDLFNGKMYQISPDFNTQSSIKFTSIIRLLKFSTRDIEINQEYLRNKYLSVCESAFRTPLAIALDILSGSIVADNNNQVLSSTLKLSIGTTHPTVNIGKCEYRIVDGLQLPYQPKHELEFSVKTRSIGTVKRTNTQSTGTYREPKDKNDWVLLSQRVNSTETTIIAMNSAKYRDCVLMYKPYKLELNDRGNLDTPQWLEHTLKRWGIDSNNVLGYVGVRYPNGSIDKLGIVHWHDRKNKLAIEVTQQLWFTKIVSYSKKQNNISLETGKETLKMITKYEYKDNVLKKITVPTYVKELATTTAIEKTENKIDSELAVFMSLYGIAHNSPIKPGKLSTVNDESKHINVNWSNLTGYKVAPMNKNNEVLWHPKFSCPFTLIK